MKEFKIIASKENIYTGQVKKLKEESKLPTEVVYIEDLVSSANLPTNIDNSIAYFLCCNSPLAPIAIQKLTKSECYIINEEYLIKNYSKLEVQTLLYRNHVKIPEIYLADHFENIKFPIFCKENIHEGIIVQVYNKITLERFFNQFNKQEFYLEEAIIGSDIKEFKLYFVEGKIFFKDKQQQIDNEIFRTICQKISEALNHLAVFSTDIMRNAKGEYFVIDVNPSAGFYLSDEGRKSFLDEIMKK